MVSPYDIGLALPQHPCTPALEQLLADWDAAGFEMPSKPGQMIVHGRNGRVSAGPEVTYMINRLPLVTNAANYVP